jgi:hypothetical protein
MAERKKDPLAHLKKPTRITHPEKERSQPLMDRKVKGKNLSKTLARGKKNNV